VNLTAHKTPTTLPVAGCNLVKTQLPLLLFLALHGQRGTEPLGKKFLNFDDATSKKRKPSAAWSQI